MLILILIDVQYSQKTVFSFEKVSNYSIKISDQLPTPLKLTIKTPEQHLLCCSCTIIVDFEQI